MNIKYSLIIISNSHVLLSSTLTKIIDLNISSDGVAFL